MMKRVIDYVTLLNESSSNTEAVSPQSSPFAKLQMAKSSGRVDSGGDTASSQLTTPAGLSRR
jgi:hypothetical protein